MVNNMAEPKNAKEKTEMKNEKKSFKEKLIKVPKISRKKEDKAVKEEPTTLTSKDPYDILKFVLMTEKAVRMIESQNKLVFIVDRKSDKTEIKSAAENAFGTKIYDVKTMIDQMGRKKAFVKFAKSGEAGEIAIRLGII
jgi:large subunit ribosomal protein L23